MSGMSTTLSMQRIGDGDKSELFYEIKDAILASLWAKLKKGASLVLKSYLNSEDFHTFMSDRFHDYEDPDGISFAFWDIDGVAQELALHNFEVIFALDAKRLDKLARKRGFTIDAAKHPLAVAEPQRHPFYVWGQHLKIRSWRVDRAVDAQAETDLEANMISYLKPVDITQMRAVAMTGWCRCELCSVVRKRKKIEEPALTDDVARAWAMLAEARGTELAQAAARDGDAAPVLGDWLEERGVRVPPQLVRGLATTYCWGR